MKTKYAGALIFLGIFFGAGGGLSATMNNNGGGGAAALLVFVLIGVFFAGYGFKLRKLAKQGINDTRDIIKEKKK